MYMLSNDARIVAMLLVAFSFSTQKKREALGVSPSQNTSRKYEPHAHWGEARKRCTVDVNQSGEDRPYSHRECEIHPSLLFLPVFPRLCPLGDSGADENTDCGKNSSTDR